MFGPWGYHFTKEMMDKAVADREAAIAALTPEQRAWLTAEEDWRHTLARRAEEQKHRNAVELEQLLWDDIKEFGCPT